MLSMASDAMFQQDKEHMPRAVMCTTAVGVLDSTEGEAPWLANVGLRITG